MVFFVLGFMVLTVSMVFGQPSELPPTEGLGDLFQQAVHLFSNFGALSVQYKIAAVLFLIVGTVKNSALSPWWDKIAKEHKPWVAPVLSLAAFLLLVRPFTLETFLAAITTGAAAGYFAQLLDLIKTIPAVGRVISSAIEMIGSILKRPSK